MVIWVRRRFCIPVQGLTGTHKRSARVSMSQRFDLQAHGAREIQYTVICKLVELSRGSDWKVRRAGCGPRAAY